MVVEKMSLAAINANSPYEVKVALADDNYAALIIRKDNPQFADLVSEFMATVNLLNTKPEDYDE